MIDFQNVYYLRHIPTEYNMNDIISGQSNPCTVSHWTFSNSGLRFNTIFTSPLDRCLETIQLFKRINPCPQPEIDQRLIERNLGVLEGLKKSDAALLYPEYFINNRLMLFSNPPGGESYSDFKVRVEEFVDDLRSYCRNNEHERILICSHNQTMKMIYLLLENHNITQELWNSISFKNGILVNHPDVLQ